MIICKTAALLQNHLNRLRQSGSSIGFVPTMGALHPGHISLIEAAKASTQSVVCSIFINPTQFNDPADFEKYPVTIEHDIELLEIAGCDFLYLPEIEEIYPNGTSQLRRFELGELENLHEGTFRPGHFQGVCNVVHRLLTLVAPSHLFLGQKDFQQCLVLHKMIADSSFQIAIETVSTLREPTGLAMSSRNSRLSDNGREKAASIFRVLTQMKEKISLKENHSEIINWGIEELHKFELKTEYLVIADSTSLKPVSDGQPSNSMVILIAAYLENVRLIDNLPINNQSN